MSIFLKICLLVLTPSLVLSRTLDRPAAEKFVRSLLLGEGDLGSWFDSTSLAISHRLGIEYDGVEYKNLIGYDVDDSVKELVRTGQLSYSFKLDTLEGDYTRLTIRVGEGEIVREFYFRGDRSTSPLAYFGRNWTTTDSKHFRFIISDTTLFNSYCIEKLESFLLQMADVLGLEASATATLERQKIYYYLCRNEEEVRQLTGFSARGMYNLAYDALVTTFSNHRHELVHLLMNYALRRLPLYTHPFLQEGIAAAYGGRGGIDPGVLLSLGEFLWRSRFVDLPSLLTRDGFQQLDASVSYPAAGLYNRFLLEDLGPQRYLRLYRSHSGSPLDAAVQQISSAEVPVDTLWKQYIEQHARDDAITLGGPPAGAAVVFDADSTTVYQDSARLYFLIADALALPGKRIFPHYVSKVFRDVLPLRRYRGEQYLIRVTADEAAVYNLLTNDIIAEYASSFSLPPKSVPRQGRRYLFSVRKDVFDAPFEFPQDNSPGNPSRRRNNQPGK